MAKSQFCDILRFEIWFGYSCDWYSNNIWDVNMIYDNFKFWEPKLFIHKHTNVQTSTLNINYQFTCISTIMAISYSESRNCSHPNIRTYATNIDYQPTHNHDLNIWGGGVLIMILRTLALFIRGKYVVWYKE